MLDGIIVFNKPRGYTSHDAIARIRGITHAKVGHAGTLDPQAEGVLVVLLGAACKASDYILTNHKTYRAGIRFGMTSDTQDIWGEVTQTGAPLPDEASFLAAFAAFEGGYDQLPPMYSAVQKDGARLYDLARRGIEVQRESRWVDLSDFRLLSFENGRAEFEITCSKGTFIRALCHDIGEKLGCGAVMDSLIRLSSGDFTLEQATTFEALEDLAHTDRLQEAVIPMETVFSFLPRVDLDEKGLIRALNGAYIGPKWITSGEVPAEDGVLCALYAPDGRIATLARSGKLAVGGAPALFYEKTFYTGDRP